MSKKILMISVRADYGGGPEHVFQLVRNISTQFDVYVALPCDKPYWGKFSRLLGSDKLIKIPHRRFSITELFKMLLFIKDNDIKVIHSHGKGAGLYSRLLKLIAPSSTKVIHSFHGVGIGEYSFLPRRLYIIYERLFSYLTNFFYSCVR